MARPRRIGSSWVALLGVVAVTLGGGGIALAANRSSPPSAAAPAGLAAAGLEPQPEATSTTVTTAPPVTTTARATTTTTPKPPTSTTVKPVVPTTLKAPAGVTTTVHVVPPVVGTPATNPSSWTLDDNGIVSHVRIEPAQPHVGDTITVTFGSTATVPTDYCCIEFLYVDGAQVFNQMHGQGPCPLAQGPAEQQYTFVAAHAGTLGLQLQANRVKLCFAPPEFTTTNLYAAVSVLPA